MKLKFMRFDSVIDFDDGTVHTLEVHERPLFARMVESLKSNLGEKAAEPFVLLEGERSVAPKGRLLMLSNFPELPLHDKTIEKSLYERIASEIAEGVEPTGGILDLGELAKGLNHQIEKTSLSMWGTYSFEMDWDLARYLKAFGYGLTIDEDTSLLDRCIRFFGLCVDIGFKKPLVGFNIKSFFSEIELDQLFEQAIFHGIPLLLLETWWDGNCYKGEKKMVIEQGFLEMR